MIYRAYLCACVPVCLYAFARKFSFIRTHTGIEALAHACVKKHSQHSSSILQALLHSYEMQQTPMRRRKEVQKFHVTYYAVPLSCIANIHDTPGIPCSTRPHAVGHTSDATCRPFYNQSELGLHRIFGAALDVPAEDLKHSLSEASVEHVAYATAFFSFLFPVLLWLEGRGSQ